MNIVFSHSMGDVVTPALQHLMEIERYSRAVYGASRSSFETALARDAVQGRDAPFESTAVASLAGVAV